jgi:hypothetical protein
LRFYFLPLVLIRNEEDGEKGLDEGDARPAYRNDKRDHNNMMDCQW